MPLRISIFEDNRDYRESLCQFFRYASDVEVVGAHPDCSNLLDAVLTEKPQVILMDIDMPSMSGIEATEIVKEHVPETQIIILTVSEEENRIFQALQNGATGYLLKKTSPEELLEAVHSVHRGGSPMSPAIARKVLQFFRNRSISPPHMPPVSGSFEQPPDNVASNTLQQTKTSDLTPREREILEGLVDGFSYKMIAAKYFISPETVKNHIQGIYRKLQVNSKGEAISLAIRRQLV